LVALLRSPLVINVSPVANPVEDGRGVSTIFEAAVAQQFPWAWVSKAGSAPRRVTAATALKTAAAASLPETERQQIAARLDRQLVRENSTAAGVTQHASAGTEATTTPQRPATPSAVPEPSPTSDAEAGLATSVPDPEAHLSLLTPEAHTAFTNAPNGTVKARVRQPDGGWSAAMPVRPPRFDTRAEASLPVCTGWCSGCGAPSTWRADQSPTTRHWHCVRCTAMAAKPP